MTIAEAVGMAAAAEGAWFAAAGIYIYGAEGIALTVEDDIGFVVIAEFPLYFSEVECGFRPGVPVCAPPAIFSIFFWHGSSLPY